MPVFWLMSEHPLKKIDSSSQDISFGGGWEKRIKEEEKEMEPRKHPAIDLKASGLFKIAEEH